MLIGLENHKMGRAPLEDVSSLETTLCHDLTKNKTTFHSLQLRVEYIAPGSGCT